MHLFRKQKKIPSKMNKNKFRSIGLAKKFVQVFPYDVTGKPERTFWPTQYHRQSLKQHKVKFLKEIICLK